MDAAAHWSDRYMELRYDQVDCAALAERVQREVFGRDVTLPSERSAALRGLTRQINAAIDDYAARTDTPRDGDGVLLIGRGRLNHVGIYFEHEGAPWVLHSMRKAGQVVRHRIRDLGNMGLAVEGYYRWICG